MAAFIPNLRTYQVFPDVPAPLQPLLEMAANLWWVWQPDAVELFRRLDRNLWQAVSHNPIKLLGTIDQAKLASAAKDPGYLVSLNRVHQAFRQHLSQPGWYNTVHGANMGDSKTPFLVAYFSAEFGLH